MLASIFVISNWFRLLGRFSVLGPMDQRDRRCEGGGDGARTETAACWYDRFSTFIIGKRPKITQHWKSPNGLGTPLWIMDSKPKEAGSSPLSFHEADALTWALGQPCHSGPPLAFELALKHKYSAEQASCHRREYSQVQECSVSHVKSVTAMYNTFLDFKMRRRTYLQPLKNSRRPACLCTDA